MGRGPQVNTWRPPNPPRTHVLDFSEGHQSKFCPAFRACACGVASAHHPPNLLQTHQIQFDEHNHVHEKLGRAKKWHLRQHEDSSGQSPKLIGARRHIDAMSSRLQATVIASRTVHQAQEGRSEDEAPVNIVSCFCSHAGGSPFDGDVGSEISAIQHMGSLQVCGRVRTMCLSNTSLRDVQLLAQCAGSCLRRICPLPLEGVEGVIDEDLVWLQT